MSHWYRDFQSKITITEGWYAVFRQETGEEGIIHPEGDESVNDVIARAPEEWSFVGTESDRDAHAEAQRRYDNDEDDLY